MELLAPAGNWDAFKAAINNGADAVYVGGKQFSARQSAANFDLQEMEKAVIYAHLRDRKVYVTVNTLIDNQEFAMVLDYLCQLAGIGVDAVILQDIGLLDAAHAVLPALSLHASTQMTIHSQSGAALLEKLGVERIVLARELTSEEIKIIHRSVPGIKIEVFVHGALCYGYSGQCLLSSIIGGRSGNRGRCAQACRLPYDLYRDQDKVQPPGQGKYLLSPADLCLIDYLQELKEAGVSSLKIEGRMRRPEYVAVVTRAYREVLDQLEQNPGHLTEFNSKERLSKIFNRNFTTGYFIEDNQEFMSTRSPKNIGVMVGRVEDQSRSYLTRIKLSDTVRKGDGLAIWTGPDRVQAVLIKDMIIDGKSLDYGTAGQTIEIKLEGPVSPSNPVYKTHDEQLLSEAQNTYTAKEESVIPVDAKVIMNQGEKMRLLMQCKGNCVEVVTAHQLEKAERQPLTEEILRQKIGRLGNTPFFLRNLTTSGDDNLMVPLSALNDARRRAIQDLQTKILLGSSVQQNYDDYHHYKRNYLRNPITVTNPIWPLLTVTVTSPEHAMIALQGGADRVYLTLDGLCTGKRVNMADFEKIQAGRTNGSGRIIPVLPRIHKLLDQFDYRKQFSTCIENVMIASWADLEWAREREFGVTTDYNMNVFNQYTLRFLTTRGVDLVCLSPELSLKQLTRFSDLSQAELVVQGELIIMQSQFCILGQTRGPGKPVCSMPCRQASYSLKDRRGYRFPLETDCDCHLYLFNSRTICMAEDLERILSLKPAALRIEARRSNSEELLTTVKIYREILDKLKSGYQPDFRNYIHQLQDVIDVPFTKGHYYRGVL